MSNIDVNLLNESLREVLHEKTAQRKQAFMGSVRGKLDDAATGLGKRIDDSLGLSDELNEVFDMDEMAELAGVGGRTGGRSNEPANMMGDAAHKALGYGAGGLGLGAGATGMGLGYGMSE